MTNLLKTKENGAYVQEPGSRLSSLVPRILQTCICECSLACVVCYISLACPLCTVLVIFHSSFSISDFFIFSRLTILIK